MSVQNRLISLKQLISLGAIAGTSVLFGFPATAQSSINSDASANPILAQAESTGDDFELSPEGFEILCERFPLNSRCEGAAGSGSDDLPGSAQDPNTDVTDPPIEPGNSPSDDSSGGTQERPGESPDGLGTPPGGSMDDTPAPGSPSDPNTDTTSPPFDPGNSPADGSEGGIQEPPGDMMPPGGTMQPPGGTMQPPGGTMQPPGGTMQPPGGTMQPPGGAPLDTRPPAAEPDDSTVPPTQNQ
ncbi:MAG: hypothetical protein HC878_09415 [Leptolyngbyaceae cyanobacterium SL_5_14]|nr:hypothetical protein [Leptolyngbyaceae cyanobacterium SL_5_14]